MVLVCCTSYYSSLHFCKVSFKYIKLFSSYRADAFVQDGQTRQTDRPSEKQYISDPVGEDINITASELLTFRQLVFLKQILVVVEATAILQF